MGRLTSTTGRCAGLLLIVGAAVAGCASNKAAHMGSKPDLSALAPVSRALDSASQSGIDKAAPQEVSAARHRVTEARAILYEAARADRNPTDSEQHRVTQLVDGAKLDMRAAKAHARMLASQNRLAAIKAQNSMSSNPAGVSSSTNNPNARPALSPDDKPAAGATGPQRASQPQTPERHPPSMNAGPGTEHQAQRPMRSDSRKIGGGQQ